MTSEVITEVGNVEDKFCLLLLNLTGLGMGEWQKEVGKWAVGIFVIFILASAVTGVVPLIK